MNAFACHSHFLKQTISLQFLIFIDDMELLWFDHLWNDIESLTILTNIERSTTSLYCSIGRFVKSAKKIISRSLLARFFTLIFGLMYFVFFSVYHFYSVQYTHARKEKKCPCDPSHGLIFAFFNYSSSFCLAWYWVMSMTT